MKNISNYILVMIFGMALGGYLSMGACSIVLLDKEAKISNLAPAKEVIFEGISYRNIETVKYLLKYRTWSSLYPFLYEQD